MCCRVLFHLEWRVTTYSSRIITGGRLIFVFFLSSNVYHCPLCFLLFNFSPHSINLFFHLFSIYRSFYFFNLVLQLWFSYMFGFLFWFLFFKIYNFVLGTLVEFFSINFILKSNFLTLKLFFNSIKPSN